MNPRRLPAALVFATTLAAFSSLGCGSGGNTGLAGTGGGHDPDGGGVGITLSGGEAGGAGLAAYVEQGQVPVTLITLGCPGECASVQAVGTGGNPPYTFSWDDGSTASTRTVCPKNTTSYSVKVTDTAAGGELGSPAQTAQARLTADVLSCADGGVPDGAPAEGGAHDGGALDGSGPLCIGNPSFEGMAKAPGIDAPPWANCTASGFDTAIIDPSIPGALQTFPPASDGSTYLELIASYTFGTGGSGIVTAPLCAPMRAGTSYSLQVDLANGSGAGLTPTSLQIVGGTQFCGMEEGLWTSPVPGTTWSTFCATLTPQSDWSYLTLELSGEATSELFIDHIVPVASCP